MAVCTDEGGRGCVVINTAVYNLFLAGYKWI